MEYFKIKAQVILTEIPIEVELEVNKVFWLTSTPCEQVNLIWSYLHKKCPVSMQVATHNTEKWKNTSWVEKMDITN